MAKKVIDAAPIIKDLAEWCLKAKGLECSVLGSVIDKLKAAPRLDAVEVVRCKDCKKVIRYGFLWCGRTDIQVQENDFCSCGERRTDG